MRNGAAGGAALYGFNMIPAHLKRRGLSEHPKMKAYLKSNGGPPDAPCGIIAFLMGYNQDHYIGDFELLVNDAAMYGELIGLESRYMTNADFDKLLDLDGFSEFRVIVFRRDGNVEYSTQGTNWEWPEDLLRCEPDPKSVYIMRDTTDQENKHYWWIASIKACAFSFRNQKPCFFCFRKSSGVNFDDHNCLGIYNYQCRICKFNFTSPESLNEHRSRTTSDYHCECCKKSSFNGHACFERHLRENCKPPPGMTRAKCLDCNRDYLIGMVHDCSDFGFCRPCDHKYIDKQDYKDHQCYLQTTETFWEPVTEKGVFNFHFAYDYETCREIVDEVDNEEEVKEFKHEVMAWCTQLMLPCDQTIRHVLESGFREKIIEKIQNSPNDIKNDIQYKMLETGSIRIQGKNIFFFIFFIF
jgi:hypothetical protein